MKRNDEVVVVMKLSVDIQYDEVKQVMMMIVMIIMIDCDDSDDNNDRL